VGLIGADGSAGGDGENDSSVAGLQGGAGGDPGAGGGGGSGGNGGLGGTGGAGAHGASGGGSFILAAKGLLEFTNTGACDLDVSAADPGAGGAGGAPNSPATVGAGGASGGSGALGGSGGGSGAEALGGPGGRSFGGGSGREGGVGGLGASGGVGGTGGYGTPGMVKLQGSVILASNASLKANYVVDATANQNGAVTMISNMTYAATTANRPPVDNTDDPNASPTFGITTYIPLLTRGTNAPYQTVKAPNRWPLIGELIGALIGGPATYGWLNSGYWNEADVDAAVGSTGEVEYVVFTTASTPASVFADFDQVVIKNTGGSLAQAVTIKIGTDPGATTELIQGVGGVAGDLAAGQSWTTTVKDGTTVVAGIGVAITAHPVSLTLNPGVPADFMVTATGTDIEYQWRKGVDDIPDATFATYTIPAVIEDDEGSFYCVVSNPLNTVNSNPATLTVNGPVVFTTQPVSLTVPYHDDAVFSVQVIGTSPFSYQWRRNGGNIADGTESTYTRTSVESLSDEGTYDCVVTNVVGPETSDGATLTVLDPAIIDQPDDQIVLPGGTAVFSVLAVGSGTLTFQWYRDGTPDVPLNDGDDGGDISVVSSGSEPWTSTLSRANIDPTDIGTYYCIVQGFAHSDESEHASLLSDDPGIAQQPDSVTVDPCEPVSFTCVGITANLPLTYQWQQDLVDVPDATESTYNIAIATYDLDGAGFRCIVTNALLDSVTSNVATLTINGDPISFVQDPVDLYLYEGQTAFFTVGGVTGGFGTPVYHWKFDDGAKDEFDVGGDSPDLSIPSVTEANEGSYYVGVTDDSCWSYWSNTATLEVGQHLIITSHPVGGEYDEGQAHTFQVGTDGGVGDLTYQWKKDGGNVGPDDSLYALSPLSTLDTGIYWVEVTDMNTGNVASNTASLIVNESQVTMPVVGILGAGLLAGLFAIGGAVAVRRKK